MSQTLITPQAAVVPRPKYVHVRSLLAIACIAILGLTIAVVLLATNRTLTAARVTGASAITRAATADVGARLDHSGRREAALLSVLAEPGARLEHRGLHASSQP
jgi:hypothetical protein